MASSKVRKTVSWILCLFIFIVFVCLGIVLGFEYTKKQSQRFEALQAYSNKKELEDNAAKTGETIPEAELAAAESKIKGVLDDNFVIPDQNTENAVMVYLDLGDTTSKIAQKLYDQGLIENRTMFNIMSKVNGFDGSYKSGTHFLLPGMSFDEMMYILTQQPKSERITFAEGKSYIDIKNILKDNGVQFDEEKMDELMDNPNEFLDYSFVQGIDLTTGRNTILEGYLFPDTYFFDLNSTEEQILRTMLSNTEAKLTDEYKDRAAAIGMTMDEVIRLASIIEKESSKVDEMYKVSRVFHNRLAQHMELQSCATVNYLRQQDGKPPVLIVRQSDLERESPYNTYRVEGLPPGPICSPGLEAIRAALYPDANEPDLMFFAAKGDGTTVFARSWEEHLNNVARYVKPLDDKLSEENGNQDNTPWVELPNVSPDQTITDLDIEEIQTP